MAAGRHRASTPFQVHGTVVERLWLGATNGVSAPLATANVTGRVEGGMTTSCEAIEEGRWRWQRSTISQRQLDR